MRHLVRAALSLLATMLGASLLLADGGLPNCDTSGGFKGGYDYVTECPGVQPTGHVAFDWHESDDLSEADRHAHAQLSNGGLRATKAVVIEDCREDDGESVPQSVKFSFSTPSGEAYDCVDLELRDPGPFTVTCQSVWPTPMATCTITFAAAN